MKPTILHNFCKDYVGQTCLFQKEHFNVAHVFRFPTYFVHFPCFVDAEKRVKEGDLRFDRELNHQIFMVLLSMHEMWNVHHQKNGVMNIRCDFFFFFMLHLWAVCQKMPVWPSHFAKDKLNLSQNCNKKTKQWGFWKN